MGLSCTKTEPTNGIRVDPLSASVEALVDQGGTEGADEGGGKVGEELVAMVFGL